MDYKEILADSDIETINEREIRKQPPKPKPMCKINCHSLRFIGGSSNGRDDGEYADVYMCSICEHMGYIETFTADLRSL